MRNLNNEKVTRVYISISSAPLVCFSSPSPFQRLFGTGRLILSNTALSHRPTMVPHVVSLSVVRTYGTNFTKSIEHVIRSNQNE